VPFAAFCTWSLVLLLQGLRGLDWSWIAGGAGVALLAIFSRQPGLALPIAFLGAAVMRHPRRPRTLAAIAVGALAMAASFTVGPSLLYGSADAGGMFSFDYVHRLLLEPRLLYSVARNSVTFVIYLGAFLAPVALLCLPHGRRAWLSLAAGSVVFAFVATAIGMLGLQLPPGIDWIHDFGLGPTGLAGADQRPRLGSGGWWAIITFSTFCAGIVGVALLAELWVVRSSLVRRAERTMLVGFPIIYLAVLLIRIPAFDRYLVPALPPLLALLMASRVDTPGVARGSVAVAVAFALAVFGVLGTRDYLEQNRARKVLFDELVRSGVPPTSIDGGFELNAWDSVAQPDRSLFSDNRPGLLNDEYVVAFVGELSGYHAIASRSYRRLLPPLTEELTVHHRDGDPEDQHEAAPALAP
jgi:hypothetical protein